MQGCLHIILNQLTVFLEFGNKDYVCTLKLNIFSGWETLTSSNETKNKFKYSPVNGVTRKILLFQKVFGDLHKLTKDVRTDEK